MRLEIGVERALGAPARRDRAEIANDEARHVGAPLDGLGIDGVDADVAYLRRSHGHDLPVVGRIGQDLLVTAHGRRKDRFTDRHAVASEGAPLEHRAVCEDHVGALGLRRIIHSSRASAQACVLVSHTPVHHRCQDASTYRAASEGCVASFRKEASGIQGVTRIGVDER